MGYQVTRLLTVIEEVRKELNQLGSRKLLRIDVVRLVKVRWFVKSVFKMKYHNNTRHKGNKITYIYVG